MANVSNYSPCPKCNYPLGVGCDFCFPKSPSVVEILVDRIEKKRGPKPRPDTHKAEPIRVPLCLHKEVKKMVKEWKKEMGYV